MEIEAISALPIGELAAPHALFLRVVQPMLPEALRGVSAGFFVFRTVPFYWIKIRGRAERAGQDRLFYAREEVRLGLGYHMRSGAEQCWLATRGRGYTRLSRGEPQVVFASLREHSRKPDEIPGATRHRVIARLRRIGVRLGRREAKAKGKAPPPARADAAPKPLVPAAPERRNPFQPKAPAVVQPRLDAPFVAPAGSTATLLGLPQSGCCRWPYDDADGVPRLVCAAATEDGAVYCPAHHTLAVQPRRAA